MRAACAWVIGLVAGAACSSTTFEVAPGDPADPRSVAPAPAPPSALQEGFDPTASASAAPPAEDPHAHHHHHHQPDAPPSDGEAVSRVTVAAIAALLGGCVAKDAGYEPARSAISERTGMDARWSHIEGGSAAAQKKNELLARPVTVESAVQVALLGNPELQAAFEEIGIARADLVAASRLPNPHGELGFGFSGSEHDPDIDVGVLWNVSRLIFLPLRAGAARSELDAASLSVAGAAMDLALQVRIAFYDLLAAERAVELRRTVVRAADASRESAQELFDAGNVTELDRLAETAIYEEARLALQTSETELVERREKMNALLGAHGIGWTPAGALAAPPEREIDLAQVEPTALARSLDLEIHLARYEAAARRANVARADGVLPDLEVGVGAEREEHEWEVGPRIELEIPLFDQGQGATARAEAEMRRERARHSSMALRVRRQARSAVSRLQAARDRAFFYGNVLVPLRQRIVAETLLAYNAMNAGVFALLQAKRDEVETARAHVEAMRDYWVARARVEQLLAGRVLPEAGAMAAAEPVSRPHRAGH